MSSKDKEEHEVTFPELKEILFKTAADEMQGYQHAISVMSEKMAEIQRQRYVSVYQVIDGAGLNTEYGKYKEQLNKK